MPKAGIEEAEIILCQPSECQQLIKRYFHLVLTRPVKKDFAARIAKLESQLAGGCMGGCSSGIWALEQERDAQLIAAANTAETFTKFAQEGSMPEQEMAWRFVLGIEDIKQKMNHIGSPFNH